MTTPDRSDEPMFLSQLQSQIASDGDTNDAESCPRWPPCPRCGGTLYWPVETVHGSISLKCGDCHQSHMFSEKISTWIRQVHARIADLEARNKELELELAAERECLADEHKILNQVRDAHNETKRNLAEAQAQLAAQQPQQQPAPDVPVFRLTRQATMGWWITRENECAEKHPHLGEEMLVVPLAAYQAERQAREIAEDNAASEHENFMAAVRGGARVQGELDDERQARERAEAERDEAAGIIHELRQKLAIAGVEGSPPPIGETTIGALTQQLSAARQTIAEQGAKITALEADCAGMREALERHVMCYMDESKDSAIIVCRYCGGNRQPFISDMSYAHSARCILAKPHPGAALLERVKGLQQTIVSLIEPCAALLLDKRSRPYIAPDIWLAMETAIENARKALEANP